MGLFNRFLGRDEQKSRQVARNRLKVILVHDRVNLSPGKMDQLKDDLVEVISRYVEIDRDGIDIALTASNRQSRLTAQFPVIGLSRQK
jgi:cell division topological specificity factor